MLFRSPITARPSGAFCSPPSPRPSAIGVMPMIMASAVMMKPSTVRRLQILGVYRDIDLAMPKEASPDAVQRAKNEQQGLSDSTFRPEDRDREIYECYCELNIPGFEHKLKGKETGLEIPYRVTIDVSTREVLSVVRNYNKDDEELPAARKTFVKYTFVPGFGFYDIGLLHILGNTTNAITAAWRELLDAGMYNNFPGFLMADTGARQNTNIFRVPPGGGALVKTGGMQTKSVGSLGVQRRGKRIGENPRRDFR